MLRSFRLRMRALILRRRLDRDIEDELAFHLEMRHQSGIPQPRFGSSSQIREACREVWTFVRLEELARDIRHAFRVLVRTPGHTAAITVLLGLGIGANAAIFSLVNAIYLRDLPVHQPEQLVLLKRMANGMSQGVSLPLFEELRQHVTSLSGLVGIADIMTTSLTAGSADDGEARDVEGVMVSGNYFRLLGIHAAIGRTITEEDDRYEAPNPVLMLSHDFWRRRFGGDRGVIGRSVLLFATRFTVIGVAGEQYRGLGGDRGVGGDFWAPLNMQPVLRPGGDRRRNPGSSMLRVMGRLREGVPICEKPLAITPEGVDRVLRAARRSKTFLQIGQQLRYFPSMREAIRQIHEGIAGKTYIVKAHRHGGKSRPREGGAEQTAQQKTRATWYADVKRSGDLIVENAVHNIDACNWIANSRPLSAYGHGKKYFPRPIPPGTVMMDGFSVEYIYDNEMHCDYSQISFHPRHLKTLPSGMWYTVFGEKGTVYLTHSSATFYDLYGETEPRNLLPAGINERDTATADFYACIRENRQPFADVRVGAVAALTAIMGREAIYKGRSVTWKELGVEV